MLRDMIQQLSSKFCVLLLFHHGRSLTWSCVIWKHANSVIALQDYQGNVCLQHYTHFHGGGGEERHCKKADWHMPSPKTHQRGKACLPLVRSSLHIREPPLLSSHQWKKTGSIRTTSLFFSPCVSLTGFTLLVIQFLNPGSRSTQRICHADQKAHSKAAFYDVVENLIPKSGFHLPSYLFYVSVSWLVALWASSNH